MEGNNTKYKTFSFLLAVSPILDPYSIMGLPLMYIMVGAILFILVTSGLTVKLYTPLLILLIVITFTTLSSFIISDEHRQLTIAIKSLIVWFAYFVAVSILWTYLDNKKFLEYAGRIAIFSSLFLILQLLLYFIGVNPPSGMLPGLELSEYNGWAPLIDVTGELRLHSFFQEPSYFAIYTLPVCVFYLKNKRYILATFLIICCIITTSTLALAGISILFLWFLFTSKIPFQKMLLIMVIFVLVHLFSYNFIGVYKEAFTYSLSKLTGISTDLGSERMGSTNIRLIGYIDYFFHYYSIQFKVLGVGANQFPYYLSSFGVASYSSTIVVTILNYGLIGILTLLYVFISFLKNTKFEYIIYPVIFVMICFVDAFWFSWSFFYILTFSYIHLKKRSDLKLSFKNKI